MVVLSEGAAVIFPPFCKYFTWCVTLAFFLELGVVVMRSPMVWGRLGGARVNELESQPTWTALEVG